MVIIETIPFGMRFSYVSATQLIYFLVHKLVPLLSSRGSDSFLLTERHCSLRLPTRLRQIQGALLAAARQDHTSTNNKQ